MPNAIGVMIVAIFLEIPNAILGEAFLSFLGLGVQSPETSWGVLAAEGYKYIRVQPYLMWVPALLIASTVLAAVAVADGVRDALDPRGQVH
jgi:oligopeptide transport system permease protein